MFTLRAAVGRTWREWSIPHIRLSLAKDTCRRIREADLDHLLAPPAISRDERHPFEYRRIGSSAPLQSTNRTSGGGQSSVPAPSSGVADGRSPWSRVTREMHSGKLLCTSFSEEPLDGTIMT